MKTTQPTLAQMKLALANGGGVEVKPTVKDDAIQRKVPEMESAAKAVSAGDMSHEDYDKVVDKHKPVKPYEFVPKPATDEDADRALMANKKPSWRGHEQWPAGRKVGLRLDIPAYENHGVWVNSIHDEEGNGEDKRKTSYGPVSSVKNASFDAGPGKGIKVATGEQNKSPFARIKGELHHMSEDEAVEHMKKNLNHPDYAQVGMDPRRHGFFYDRKTMKPVTHAEHVVQIGPLVLAHKPTYGERNSYAEGGTVKPFDFENPEHVENVANIVAKHKDFSVIPGVAKHLADSLSQGSYKFIEDPRIQSAIKKAGHTSYYIQGKDGKQQIVRKASGGAVAPSMAQMRVALAEGGTAEDRNRQMREQYAQQEAENLAAQRAAVRADMQRNGEEFRIANPGGSVETSSRPYPTMEAIPQAELDAARSKLSPEQQNFIDWQMRQINPMTHRLISEEFASQGSNPYSNGKVAQEQIDRAGRRQEMFDNAGVTPEVSLAPFNDPNWREKQDVTDRERRERQERNRLNPGPFVTGGGNQLDLDDSMLVNALPVQKHAQGGNVSPSMAQMRMELAQKSSNVNLQSIGANEAPNMSPKHFFPPAKSDVGTPSPGGQAPNPGGAATPSGMPIGGVDMSQGQPGNQLMPTPPAPPQGAAPGAPGQPPGAPGGNVSTPGGLPGAPAGPTPPMGNMLSMTPQGQAMNAMGAQKLAKGGTAKSVDSMKSEMAAKDTSKDKRVTIKADGPGNVKGIVVPRHTLEGNAKVGAVGLHQMNEARAKVYGDDHRPPLTLNKIASEHKRTLAEHFAKPVEEQHAAEAAALKRLRDAKHLGKDANTLDESEKLDTVRHEHDEQGRTHVGFAAKGVAGHALYTSGKGDDTKYHVINTCPGQTEGCGGGKDSEGIVDTKKGTCFAPNAESQYAGAATRRAAHAQAKHDPAMTNDWILSHTGSLRNAAKAADKKNQRLLFRPNVVDETDVSSRHVIRHLNEQRKADGKPDIIANSYGKTNELHDPENGYHVTHSNVGPKVKKGQEIAENVGRDKARVRNTIMAADNKGDFKNEQGNKTPPKGSYMVTDVKRGSPMSKKMEEHITHAKYWTTGRAEHELSDDEKKEGPEGHYSGSGRKTSEENAHYGHRTHEGLRYDYQKQHILHPRLVQVGENKDKTPHMIPTDSRFKDTEFLPTNRYQTKNGKEAGHMLMTTPTESTSNVGHQTSFTHNVSDKHIEHAQKNNGEYEIDKPEDQAKAKGKEYTPPQAIKFYAEGGSVGGRHEGFAHDDFHAFPEQNPVAQRHMAMRRGDDEAKDKYHSAKKAVVVHKSLGAMKLEMSNKKAK